MTRLTVTLLGGFEVQADLGRPLPVSTRKAQALLAYLALTPGQAHPRDKLAALLWGELSPGMARNALRQSLFLVRKALGELEHGVLVVTGDSVTVEPDALPTDVVAFERAVADRSPAALERAGALYRGDLLAGLSVEEPAFEDWLMSERERLRELALEALARALAHQRDYFRLGQAHSVLGDRERARQAARRAIDEARGSGDWATVGKACTVLAREAYWLGRPHDGVRHGRRALRLLEKTSEAHWLGIAHWVVGRNYWLLGESEAALTAEECARAIGAATGDLRVQSHAAPTAGALPWS